MKAKANSAFEDTGAYAYAYAQFINSTGEISRVLYLARHPEEKEEARRPARARKPKVSKSLGQAAV